VVGRHWPSRLSLLVGLLLDGPPQTEQQAAGQLLVRCHLDDGPDVGVDVLVFVLWVLVDEFAQFPYSELYVLIVGRIFPEEVSVPPPCLLTPDDEGVGVGRGITECEVENGHLLPGDHHMNNWCSHGS